MLESLESLYMVHALYFSVLAYSLHISLLSGSEEIRSRSQIQY